MKFSITCCAVAALAAMLSAPAAAAGRGPTMKPESITTTRTMGAGAHSTITTTLSSPTRTTQLGPASTGQPNQTCGSATAPSTPGHAATAPGSAFNPSGTSGGVYAGEQPQNSVNTASVSQYDVACARP
jgi:hypothetical protein